MEKPFDYSTFIFLGGILEVSGQVLCFNLFPPRGDVEAKYGAPNNN